VGVVLMAAMLVGPAVAARQWTNRLSVMIVLSAVFGALAGVSGAFISISQKNIPTGPMIILSLTVIVLVSLFFAPARGLVWEWLQRRKHRQDLKLEASATMRARKEQLKGG
jgi:manganese/zinc/iron transport system permease protein